MGDHVCKKPAGELGIDRLRKGSHHFVDRNHGSFTAIKQGLENHK